MSNTFPAMIFAAGFGTRMRHLTQDRPKPLINVAGEPLIDHALRLVELAGCAPIVANLHYLAPMLEQHLEPKRVKTSLEQPDILETGGGLRNALPLLGDGPVVTLNSDAVWKGPNPIDLLKQAWDPERMSALVVCIPLTRARGHNGEGDFILSANGRIKRGPGVIYGGAQIVKTESLHKVQERIFSMNVIWDEMIEAGRMFGLIYPGHWCDVGHPDGIKDAEDLLGDGLVS